MGLEITQFGGGYGSFAGDSCVVTFTNGSECKHIMIDLGIPSQYGCAIDYMQRGRWELWGIVFTHFHRDHTGEAKSFLSRIGL